MCRPFSETRNRDIYRKLGLLRRYWKPMISEKFQKRDEDFEKHIFYIGCIIAHLLKRKVYIIMAKFHCLVTNEKFMGS